MKELLEASPMSFRALQTSLDDRVRDLEDDLRHLEKSLRAGGQRLTVEPARCEKCAFEFRGRSAKHFHKPSRCPQCRGERITEPVFRVR